MLLKTLPNLEMNVEILEIGLKPPVMLVAGLEMEFSDKNCPKSGY